MGVQRLVEKSGISQVSVSVGYINVNGLKADKVKSLLKEFQGYNIIVLVETHLNEQDTIDIPGYAVLGRTDYDKVFKTRGRSPKGVLFLVEDHLDRKLNTIIFPVIARDGDLSGIKIGNTTILGCYRENINSNYFQEDFYDDFPQDQLLEEAPLLL